MPPGMAFADLVSGSIFVQRTTHLQNGCRIKSGMTE